MKKNIWKIIIGVAAFVFALIIVLNSFVIVQAGNVKVLTQFGRTTGVSYYPGIHVKIPFVQNTVNYSTRQVTYETSDESESSKANYTDFAIDTTSLDGQQIQLKFTIRFSIDGKQAEWILNNIGTMNDLVEKVVKAEARSYGRNIPKRYTAAQLYSEQVFVVQDEISNTLRPIFERNGILLDEFLLRKIDFTEEYFNVLEDKQIAEERIVVEKNILEQEKIKKEQVIIQAEAEAKEIEIRGEALKENPEIIQLEFIQKLSPNIAWGIIPGEGVIPILDIANLQDSLKSMTSSTTVVEPQSTDETSAQTEETAE